MARKPPRRRPGVGLEGVADPEHGGGGQPGGHRRLGGGGGARVGSPSSGTQGAPGQPAGQGQQQHREEDSAAEQHGAVETDPAGRVELAHRPDGGQRRQCDRATHGEDHSCEDSNAGPDPTGHGRLGPGHAQGAEHLELGGGAVEQLGKALADQDHHGEGNEAAEYAERDRLRFDGLLHLTMDGVEAAEGKVESMAEGRGQVGQLRLQGRDARIALGQPDPDPRELDSALEAGRRRIRGRLRQYSALCLVELVHQHRRLLHNAHDPVGGVAVDDRPPPFAVFVLVRDLAPHADPEEFGHTRGEGDLMRGCGVGQPTPQHGHRVLRDVLALEASGDAIGHKGVVEVPVHDRVGIEPQPVGARTNTAQVAHLGEERGP